MLSEAPPTGSPALSPRAAVALLTLQLRAVRQEIAAVETSALDHDAALAELRAKLEPLLHERCRTLDDELTAERAEADRMVASAKAQADQIVAEAEAKADEARAAQEASAAAAAELAASAPATANAVTAPSAGDGELDDLTITGLDFEPPQLPPATLPAPAGLEAHDADTLDALTADEFANPDDVDKGDVAPIVIVPRDDEPAPESARAFLPAVPEVPVARSISVTLDAEAFARVFAEAIAPLLEARAKAPPTEPVRIVQQVAPPPPKKSFWSHAWHADVLLSLLAMGIVLAVLIAWTR